MDFCKRNVPYPETGYTVISNGVANEPSADVVDQTVDLQEEWCNKGLQATKSIHPVMSTDGDIMEQTNRLLVSTIARLMMGLLLSIPAMLFLADAFLVFKNNGKRIELNPIPTLQTAAKYSPTVFPFVFTATAGSLLKALAAWKLERGITVLDLEYLLSSQTVFSTITTPLSLRSVSILKPLLIVLWELSLLGGQAAFRILEVVPTTMMILWHFGYLENMSPLTLWRIESGKRDKRRTLESAWVMRGLGKLGDMLRLERRTWSCR